MLAGLMLSAVLAGCTADPVETDLLLPVDFSNVPDNMVLTRFHTDKIEIKVRAAPELIDAIQVQNTRYLVDIFTDLSFDPAGDTVSIEPGEYLFRLKRNASLSGPGSR